MVEGRDQGQEGGAESCPVVGIGGSDLFKSFFDTPEFRARVAERDRKRAIKRAEVLREYGSEDAVFADAPEEIALRAAVEHLIVMKRWDDGKEYVSSLAGWTGIGAGDLPSDVRSAIEGAIPMPATVAATWTEYLRWDKLSGDRCACEPAFEDWYWVQARELLLEEALNTQPATSAADIIARFDWMQFLHDMQSSWTREQEPIRLATLRADVTRLAEGCSDCEHPSTDEGNAATAGPTASANWQTLNGTVLTASARRVLVLSMLGNPETSGLSDREIARRAGVSPTTVGKLRRTAR